MLKNLRIVRPLIPGKVGGWLSLALVGSILLALLDTLGVAAMLPLMQVITTGDTKSGVPGFVSELLGTSELQTIIIALASIVGLAFVVKSCFSVSFRWWLLGHTTRMMAQASTELMKRYVLAPYSKHKARNLPEVFRNIGAAVPQAFNQVLLGALSLVADLLTLLAMAVVLLAVSPLATLFAGVILGLASTVIQRVMRRHLLAAGESGAEADLESWSALLPGLEGFREARLTSSGGTFINGFSKAKYKLADAQRRMSMFSELPKYALEITFMVAIIGMTAVLFATSTPTEAVATLGVFAAASLRMLPTLNRVTATMASMKAGTVGLDILARAVKDLDSDQMHSESARSDVDYSGDIRIQNLVYTYPDSDVAVLNGLTLSIRAGETTAFVGSSGAGKSTLLDLILGLTTPTSGSILAGGRPVTEDLAAWYKTLGVVPQEVYLTNSTLRENIAYGLAADQVDEAQLEKALKDSQLFDFVETLPEQLDTVLGERGVRLSGGQRQRVGIARALYRQPRYLILDEATSALDNVTERQITDTIDALRGRMTVIVVAHRLSTVKNADTIIFLDKGHASSVGTFEELRASNAEFDNLVRLGQLS